MYHRVCLCKSGLILLFNESLQLTVVLIPLKGKGYLRRMCVTLGSAEYKNTFSNKLKLSPLYLIILVMFVYIFTQFYSLKVLMNV